MLVIIKIALMFFILGFLMVGVVGLTLCFQLVQKLHSTVRDILYIGIVVITFVTIFMDLSYRGLPLIAIYGLGFVLIGLCSIPPRIFMEITRWNPKIK